MPKGIYQRKQYRNLIGEKFGKLIVLFEDSKNIPSRINPRTYCCKCDCGNIRNYAVCNELIRNKIKSCGCDFPKGHCRAGLSKDLYYEHVRKVLLSRVNYINGCWEYTGQLMNKGYGFKCFGQGKEKRKRPVHQIAYVLWKGEIPKGLCVLHTCDNRKCFNPDHLWLGTQADNMKDKGAKGRGSYNKGKKRRKV